jgi:hypothetical protein
LNSAADTKGGGHEKRADMDAQRQVFVWHTSSRVEGGEAARWESAQRVSTDLAPPLDTHVMVAHQPAHRCAAVK